VNLLVLRKIIIDFLQFEADITLFQTLKNSLKNITYFSFDKKTIYIYIYIYLLLLISKIFV